MKQFLWGLLIGFIIVGSTGNITSQEADQLPLNVFIGYDFAASEDVARLNEMIVSLQGRLGAAFQAENLVVSFTNDEEIADLHINLDLADNQATLYIDLAAVDPFPPALPSPYLMPHLHSGLPLSGSPDNPRLEEVTVEIIVAIGAYIRGDCATTTEQLSSVLPTIDTVAVFIEQLTAYLNFYLANCALIDEDYEIAGELYQTNLDIYNVNNFADRYRVEASVNLAWIYFEELGDATTALALLDFPILTHTEWLGVYPLAMRAYIYAMQANHDAAFAEVEAAINLMPGDPSPYVLSGQIYLLFQEWDNALGDFDWVDKNFGDYPDTYFYRGMTLHELGEDADAVADFATYLEMAPHGFHAEEAQEYINTIGGN